MINKRTLAKALIDIAKDFADTNSIDFVADGGDYDPDVSTEYIKEFVLYGDDNMPSMGANSTDTNSGIYQLNIYIPKTTTGNKWRGLELVGLIQAEYPKATIISESPYTAIKTSSLSSMMQDDTHTYHALSIGFIATG